MENAISNYIARKLSLLDSISEQQAQLEKKLSRASKTLTKLALFEDPLLSCLKIAKEGPIERGLKVRSALQKKMEPKEAGFEPTKSLGPEVIRKSKDQDRILPRMSEEVSDSTNRGSFFECTCEPISATNNSSNICQDIGQIGSTPANFLERDSCEFAMSNYDKMYLKEILELSDVEEEEGKLDNKVFCKRILFSFSKFVPSFDASEYSAIEAELECLATAKKLSAKIFEVEEKKQNLVSKFRMVSTDSPDKFQFSVFSSIYLRCLSDDFAKVKSNFVMNDFVEAYLQVYRLLTGETIENFQSFVDDIRERKEFPSISIGDKISIEKILERNLSVLDFSLANKRDKLTTSCCYFIRDLVFFHGIINNSVFVTNNVHNNAQHYKYLAEKKAHLVKLRARFLAFARSLQE